MTLDRDDMMFEIYGITLSKIHLKFTTAAESTVFIGSYNIVTH